MAVVRPHVLTVVDWPIKLCVPVYLLICQLDEPCVLLSMGVLQTMLLPEL